MEITVAVVEVLVPAMVVDLEVLVLYVLYGVLVEHSLLLMLVH